MRTGLCLSHLRQPLGDSIQRRGVLLHGETKNQGQGWGGEGWGGGGDMVHNSDPRSDHVDLGGEAKPEGFTLPRV